MRETPSTTSPSREVVLHHGAGSRSSKEGALRKKLWAHKDISDSEAGFKLGLIISALIFREEKKKKRPKLEEIVQY
jgi:hypothetical protein